MPVPYLIKLAKKHHMPLAKAEEYWEKAKKAAEKAGKSRDWAYVTGIFKRMMGETSSLHRVIARLRHE